MPPCTPRDLMLAILAAQPAAQQSLYPLHSRAKAAWWHPFQLVLSASWMPRQVAPPSVLCLPSPFPYLHPGACLFYKCCSVRMHALTVRATVTYALKLLSVGLHQCCAHRGPLARLMLLPSSLQRCIHNTDRSHPTSSAMTHPGSTAPLPASHSFPSPSSTGG